MSAETTPEQKIKALEVNPIASAVMKAMDRTPEEVLSKCRRDEFVECRRVIAYFLSTIRYWGPVKIGVLLDNDHGNITKTLKKANDFIQTNKRFREMIETIKPLVIAKLKQEDTTYGSSKGK